MLCVAVAADLDKLRSLAQAEPHTEGRDGGGTGGTGGGGGGGGGGDPRGDRPGLLVGAAGEAGPGGAVAGDNVGLRLLRLFRVKCYLVCIINLTLSF